jgi:hypothetical protein
VEETEKERGEWTCTYIKRYREMGIGGECASKQASKGESMRYLGNELCLPTDHSSLDTRIDTDTQAAHPSIHTHKHPHVCA